MRSLLVVWLSFCVLGCANAVEFIVTRNQTDLVIEGRYLTQENNKGKEFWICLDYESAVPSDVYDANPYPVKECGDEPKTKQNLYWYAIHGIWTDDDVLSVLFESMVQLWPSGETNVSEFSSGPFHWNSNVLRLSASDSNDRLKLIQSHGMTNYGVKRSDVDTALLIGSGSVHVRAIAKNTEIHVRVNDGAGVTVERVYETDSTSPTTATTTDSSISSEETVTEPTMIDEDNVVPFMFLSANMGTNEDQNETIETPKSIEWHVVDSVPAVEFHRNSDKEDSDKPATTTDVPKLLILNRDSSDNDEGIQARPSINIPFVEEDPLSGRRSLALIIPVYDRSFEESRLSGDDQRPFQFEKEISEEQFDVPTTEANQPERSTTELTTKPDEQLQQLDKWSDSKDFETRKDAAIQDEKLQKYDPAEFLILSERSTDYDYKLLYTIAIGTAFAFLFFFIAIVLFRFYSWGQSDKYNLPVSRPQHVVYTIGGAQPATYPIKVQTS